MSNYQIVADSACDFTIEMATKLDVKILPIGMNFKGETLRDSVEEEVVKKYYDAMREGETITTFALNPDEWYAFMEPILQEGKDILAMPFSSGLSSTCQNCEIAASELREKYPERKIRVTDTLSGTLGTGSLIYQACQKRDAGEDLDTVADWVIENRNHQCAWFTVEDLVYLKRGGRVSAATALAGAALNIKPVLHIDDEGKLENVDKVRGRKASLKKLLEHMKKTATVGEDDVVFIAHGDCADDANELADMIKKEFKVKEVVVGYLGCVIGAHTGPGLVALFYTGKNKD